MPPPLYTMQFLAYQGLPAGNEVSCVYLSESSDQVVFVVKWIGVYFGEPSLDTICSCVLLDMHVTNVGDAPTVWGFSSSLVQSVNSIYIQDEITHVCLPVGGNFGTVLRFVNTSSSPGGGGALPAVDVAISGWQLTYNPDFNWFQQ